MPKPKRAELIAEAQKAGLDQGAAELAADVRSVEIAVKLLASDSDIDSIGVGDALDLLAASKDLEGKALDAYRKLARKLGPALQAAAKEYETHQARTMRLYRVATSGLGSNGAAS